MSESNNIYENFEDALFRLLMDRVAVVEGERLLRENEELKSDPDATVPEVVQKRCLKVIKTTFERKKRIRAQKTGLRIMRFVVVAAAVIMMLGIVAFAAIPTFRSGVMNILLSFQQDTIKWEFTEETNSSVSHNDDELCFTVELPKGYSLEEHAIDGLHETAIYRNKDDSSLYIEILVTRDQVSIVSTDIEDVDYYEEFIIHENDHAVLTIKDEITRLSWSEAADRCFVSIVTNGLAPQDVKGIAVSYRLKQ